MNLHPTTNEERAMSEKTASLISTLESAEMTLLADAHGLTVLDPAELQKLAGHPAGVIAMQMLQTALFQLQDAVRDAKTHTARVADTAKTVAEHLDGGLREDGTWVLQAAEN